MEYGISFTSDTFALSVALPAECPHAKQPPPFAPWAFTQEFWILIEGLWSVHSPAQDWEDPRPRVPCEGMSSALSYAAARWQPAPRDACGAGVLRDMCDYWRVLCASEKVNLCREEVGETVICFWGTSWLVNSTWALTLLLISVSQVPGITCLLHREC